MAGATLSLLLCLQLIYEESTRDDEHCVQRFIYESSIGINCFIIYESVGILFIGYMWPYFGWWIYIRTFPTTGGDNGRRQEYNQENREGGDVTFERRQHYVDRNIRYSNTRNNHDHLKHKHATQSEAKAEVRRMKAANYDGCERLNAYYNPDLDGWYVGRGW
jgi:hypothetical protein